MQSGQTFSRVIWAINPFDHSPQATKRILEFLKKASPKHKIEVEPVYVLQINSNFFKAQLAADLSDTLRHAAETQISKILKTVDIAGLLPPKVVLTEEWSLSKSARRLDQYATETRSDLIIVSTHGRKRLARAMLGSFVETLLATAHTPVLVVSPKCRPMKRHAQVLFPTDLEQGASLAGNWAAAMAKQLNGDVRLYHSLPHFLDPLVFSGAMALGGGWVSLAPYENAIENDKRAEAKQLIQKGPLSDLKIKTVIEKSQFGTAIDILKYANSIHPALIVMAAQSGPIASAILGSVTRSVIRESQCPVLVIRGSVVNELTNKMLDDDLTASFSRVDPNASQVGS